MPSAATKPVESTLEVTVDLGDGRGPQRFHEWPTDTPASRIPDTDGLTQRTVTSEDRSRAPAGRKPGER